MAYNQALLRCCPFGGLDTNTAIWIYGPTTDSYVTVQGNNYFTTGGSLGMKVGDPVVVIDPAGATLHAVESVQAPANWNAILPGTVAPGAATISPAEGAGGGGLGPSIAFAPAAGVIDPAIAGFSSGTGRINVTLAGNTSFEGLPAGVDGQQLAIVVVAGAFTLTLLHLNGATAQKEMLGSSDLEYQLGDAASLYYDGGLGQWVLQP